MSMEQLEEENQRLRERVEALEQENLQYKARIKDMARSVNFDYLTGVLNRKGICREIERYLAEEKGERSALCFLDLDNFKEVNDQAGHSCGDEVLCAIAAVLQNGVLQDDLVGRFGGDEFLVYMSRTEGEQDIRKRAERICDNVSRMDICDHLTVSIGIACYPRDGQEFQELLDKADSALYQSKCTGKNRISFYGL